MLFSSLIFLFAFLPIVLILYFTIGRKTIKLQNLLLLISSLFFYAWGEPKFVLVMMLSIAVNYVLGLFVARSQRHKRVARFYLAVSVVFNLGLLFIFKYLNFTIASINNVFGNILPQTEVVLPIGISFFTFQAMSYVIDVYRNTVRVQKNPLYVALYISFFPQLIAGPIVRYSTIEEQIVQRHVTFDGFSEGVRRFIIGFLKKVILANNLALIADQAFLLNSSGGDGFSIGFAWMGALAYTLQIYFDFSGYSDMAIGLGRMFGFHFLENFNYPYISRSVSEFWRRWHISLGSWFRDYVYISLGGSRVGSKLLLVRNLFVVWSLTGIWHGANWTFILWGLFYFVLLSIEKLLNIPDQWESKPKRIGYGILTFFLVCFGWVMFRAESVTAAFHYYGAMFGANHIMWWSDLASQYFFENWVFFLIAVTYSVAGFKRLKDRINCYKAIGAAVDIVMPFTYVMLFFIAISYLVIGAYNPFIYFNF